LNQRASLSKSDGNGQTSPLPETWSGRREWLLSNCGLPRIPRNRYRCKDGLGSNNPCCPLKFGLRGGTRTHTLFTAQGSQPCVATKITPPGDKTKLGRVGRAPPFIFSPQWACLTVIRLAVPKTWRLWATTRYRETRTNKRSRNWPLRLPFRHFSISWWRRQDLNLYALSDSGFHDNRFSAARVSNLAEGWGLEPQHPFRIYSFQDCGQ
jgi:hypothetical protein